MGKSVTLLCVLAVVGSGCTEVDTGNKAGQPDVGGLADINWYPWDLPPGLDPGRVDTPPMAQDPGPTSDPGVLPPDTDSICPSKSEPSNRS